MSVDNGIGTAGRLHAVEPEPKVKTPFLRIKKRPENAPKQPVFRGIITTLGEIAGILAVSAGSGWYSIGAGLIVGGIGIFALSFLLGMPE